jgi:tmRNA-binding protein
MNGRQLPETEVKSLRFGEGSVAEAYAEAKKGQVTRIGGPAA